MRKRFRGNNRGSGLVTVIVTVAFVAMLGVTLLYMAYMNAQIKSADRATRGNFYATETKLEEERARIQNLVSSAIDKAYTAALTQYTAAEAVFESTFIGEVSAAIPAAAYDGDAKLFRYTNPVTFTDEKGYYNEIYTDFVIAAPPFEAQTSGRQELLNNYIIVANNSLTTANTALTVQGNVYAGDISVPGGTALALDSWRVISGAVGGSSGNYAVGGTLSIGANADVWVNRIVVNGGTLNITGSGSVHVADDLELTGIAPRATLEGNYFGFGDSDTDSGRSSSVIVNGRDAILNLKNAASLVLAGRSFVTGGDSVAADIPMSGSISVKGDQAAFLVPDRYLSKTVGGGGVANPGVYDASSMGSAATAPPFQGITVDAAFLADNHASVEWRFSTLGANQLLHGFLTFDTVAHRDEYFKKYYSDNNAAVQEYLRQYFDRTDPSLINPDAAGAVKSDCVYYSFSGGGYTITGGAAAPGMSYGTQYASLVSTLSKSRSAAGAPFEYFVDKAAIAADSLTGVVEFKDDYNAVRGLIVCNAGGAAFEIDSAYPDVNVVVALGGVAVTRQFNGLIIAQGNVALSASINGNPGGFELTDGHSGVTSAAFRAKSSGGRQLLEYMSGNQVGASGSVGGGNWNLNELVYYENWTKNEMRVAP
ncbi:MAG: hypothetical protein LBN99_01840 [Oscillospiraceae bacterium]|jgi:Tfp pilus assembly protein PilE|nr:hypothetical protein [Oscillospiraceae bacterium]